MNKGSAWVAAGVLAGVFSAPALPKFIEPDGATGMCKAVVIDSSSLAYTSQVLSLDKNGELIGRNDAAKQIVRTLENLEIALSPCSSLAQVVKINVCAADSTVVSAVQKAFAKQFSGTTKPAVSFVVGGLTHADALVAMDAVATAGNTTKSRGSHHLDTLGAEKNFTHVNVLPKGGSVFISGQAKPGELGEATAKTLKSLHETLQFLKLTKTDVVQIKCFIQPASAAEIAKKEIAKFFEEELVPPLVFVDWISPKLPIEIEMVVAAPENRDAQEMVSYLTPPGFQPSNVYSKVARVNYGKLVYISGLYGETNQSAEEQLLHIFEALKRVGGEAGSDFDSLAKATYYVSDAAANNKLNEVRPKFYNPKRPPAASKAMVKGVGRDGLSVTLDMIAVSK